MSNFDLSDLDALWEELNQSDDERQKQDLQTRLAQRARQYAAPLRREATYAEAEAYNVLVFGLGSERYGADVSTVRGVRPVGSLTRVPGVPSHYRGVVNVRGRIVSVLDLRRFFEIGADSDEMPQELVLVEAGELYLALLADHIEEVLSVPFETAEVVDMKYARGVTADKLVILDMEALFKDERLIISGKIEL